MEASSPLAAMQPSSAFLSHCGYRPDATESFPPYSVFGQENFNFKNMAMIKPKRDYFSMHPVRGSSPTASLAADLSQNFHIDQSPQLPTPRRALFATNFLGGLHGGDLSTPPLPSSSPGPTSDSMEISPLPHKPAFGAAFSIPLQSPTPDSTPTDFPMASGPSPLLEPAFEPAKPTILPERRKSNLLRPSLSRTKGFSTNCIPQRPADEIRMPSVKFASNLAKPTHSTSLSLSETFVESPPMERSLSRVNSNMGPPRSKQNFAGLAANIRNGSPVGGHVRKTSNPVVRPRKQFRRSLSMFESPGDIMKQEKASLAAPPLASIMDLETAYKPQLSHFVPDDQPGSLPRITKETLVEILDGKYNHVYEKLVIIDCRFEYEFSGGHVAGAVNYNDKDSLASQLFDVEPTPQALLIFHCEYSACRAPVMAEFIRNRDRTINAERYPNLTYPESYILDGGYSSFFKDYRSRCFPQNYVEMHAKEHVNACERGLGKVKQRNKLVRAQTYAFGQHSQSVEDSPTGPSRTRHEASMDLDTGLDASVGSNLRPGFDPSRIHTRRMFSY